MSHNSRADVGHAFCSYCGYPPAGRWRIRAHPVCMRCQLGSVLRTIPGSEPHFDEPFVIVDEQLTVQSISRQAELVLLAREPHSFGAPLDAFLVSDCAEDEDQLAEQIALAVAGTSAPDALELRTAGEPEVRFRARVSSCGPPAAALLVLTPVTIPDARAADDELVRLVCALDDARQGLSRVAGEGLDEALDTVGQVRVLLERIEQGLLALVRQHGPADGFNAEVSYLFPREPQQGDALPRHVRRRRARDRAPSRPPRRGD
jgi:hypothetical protein